MKKIFLMIFALVLALSTMIFIIGCTPPIDEPDHVYYSDFGAIGDGVTDDFQAIINAHAAANEKGVQVYADSGAVYYIGASNKTAVIKTDTYWGNARFIIDDSEIDNNKGSWADAWVFNIASSYLSSQINSIETINKNQEKLDLKLPQDAVLVATDNTTKRYIRRGPNQNSGANQTDVFVVDKNGYVDADAPIIWDFENVTSLIQYPIDEKVLTVSGGNFTTVANTGNADDNYMKRGIRIMRSNTILDGVYHDIIEEGTQGAPYDGFIKLENCAYVTVKNTTLSGHRAYSRPSQPSTTRGTYDINANRTISMRVINCNQTNDINDKYWWGIFTSNYSKNILFDDVQFSRFDAHQGVYNTTILNSELGWQAVSIIGSGTLIIENTKVYGANFIYFRDDYGSTWDGNVYITDCVFAPGSQLSGAKIIHTNNNGQWDFGYPCYMPETVIINGFRIEDEPAPNGYNGVLLIGAVNSGGVESYPFALTKNVFISNLVSSKSCRMPNNYLAQNIPVHYT